MIDIFNVSKKYRLYHKQQPMYNTLVETLTNRLHRLFQKQRLQGSYSDEFWALQGVSLQIQPGDRLGIIGKNGSGKTTLLKILAKITSPTEGSIRFRGRIASLLEVGTGFHPELTCRENIFLNGAILGMTKKEIQRKFDEIVAFAEIERFLDTPVKRVSIGMHTRLGFAIAAHIEPEILVVDEVLAVGDLAFQDKCLKKMDALGQAGHTLLFVSHNPHSVLSLCNKGAVLDQGRLIAEGPIEECMNQYFRLFSDQSLSWMGSEGNEHLHITSVKLLNQTHNPYFIQGDIAHLEVNYTVLNPSKHAAIGFNIWNQHQRLLAYAHTDQDLPREFFQKGSHTLTFPVDTNLFVAGEYTLKLEGASFLSEIALKFSIQSPSQRLLHQREGVFLGHHWKQT